MLKSGELKKLTNSHISIVSPKVRPMIFKPGAPDATDGTITLKLPEQVGKSYVRSKISDYKSDDVPDYIKDCLSEAVRLILDDDFSFAVEAGDASGCNYCPASMLCEKFVPKSW